MRTKDDYYGRAILSAFIASVITAVIYLVQDLGNTDPGLVAAGASSPNVIRMMAAAVGMPGQPVVGWMMHFFFGSIIGGLAYVWLAPKMPKFIGPSIVRGMVFGLLCWIVLGVTVMPAAGAGMFGQNYDMMFQISTLVAKLTYGAVLGFMYGKLIEELSKPVSERLGEKNEARPDHV